MSSYVGANGLFSAPFQSAMSPVLAAVINKAEAGADLDDIGHVMLRSYFHAALNAWETTLSFTARGAMDMPYDEALAGFAAVFRNSRARELWITERKYYGEEFKASAERAIALAIDADPEP